MSGEQKERFLGSRPLLRGIGILTLANLAIVFATDFGGDLLGLNGVQKAIAAASGWGIAFILCGIFFRNRHGGFALFIGFVALLTALLFGAMYAANPTLFSAVE